MSDKFSTETPLLANQAEAVADEESKANQTRVIVRQLRRTRHLPAIFSEMINELTEDEAKRVLAVFALAKAADPLLAGD